MTSTQSTTEIDDDEALLASLKPGATFGAPSVHLSSPPSSGGNKPKHEGGKRPYNNNKPAHRETPAQQHSPAPPVEQLKPKNYTRAELMAIQQQSRRLELPPLKEFLNEHPELVAKRKPRDPNKPPRDPNKVRDPNKPPRDPNKPPRDPNKPRDPNQPPRDPNKPRDPTKSREPTKSGQQPGKKTKQAQQQATTEPAEVVELTRRAEVPWTPVFLNQSEKQAGKIQGTLNKLTPDNFDRLSNKLSDEFTKIQQAESFTEAVGLVFDKAVSEPNFCTMYANLCSKINAKLREHSNQKDLDFRRQLLNKCQTEFENEKEINSNLSAKPDSEEVIETKEKARKRKLGNVKFIGELFKQNLLSEKIIHNCVSILTEDILTNLKENKVSNYEGAAELFCKLMSTIGKLIDTGKEQAQIHMKNYFETVAKWQTNMAFSPRIRFMFRDLIELKENKWVPRKEENKPKSIREVHEEAKQKEYEDEAFTALQAAQGNGQMQQQQTKEVQAKEQIPPQQKKGKGGKKAEPSKGAKGEKRSSAPPAKVTPVSAPSPAKKSGGLDLNNPNQVEDFLNNLFKEFFSHGEVKEMADSLEPFRSSPQASRIVELGILASCEKNERERELVSKLFAHLSKSKALNEELFVKGVSALKEFWDDLKIDYPFFEKYVDKFIGLAIQDGCVTSSAIGKVVPTLPDLDKCKYTVVKS